jgi:hypothetical protein
MSRVWVTKAGVSICNQVYWTLQLVTTSIYSAIANSYNVQLTTARTKSSQSAVFLSVVAGKGFQRLTFPLLWVPKLSLCLTYQLHRSSPLTISLTHQPTLYTPLHCSKLSRTVEWYSLGANHIENTASNSTSIVARRPLPNNDLSTVAYLRSCLIEMDVVSLFCGRCL